MVLSRGGAVAARVAHNHEVRGSSPLPATMKKDSSFDGSFFMVRRRRRTSLSERNEREVRRSKVTRRSLFRAWPQRRSDERSEGSAVLPLLRAQMYAVRPALRNFLDLRSFSEVDSEGGPPLPFDALPLEACSWQAIQMERGEWYWANEVSRSTNNNWFMYIARARTGQLHVGISINPQERVNEHNAIPVLFGPFYPLKNSSFAGSTFWSELRISSIGFTSPESS